MFVTSWKKIGESGDLTSPSIIAADPIMSKTLFNKNELCIIFSNDHLLFTIIYSSTYNFVLAEV